MKTYKELKEIKLEELNCTNPEKENQKDYKGNNFVLKRISFLKSEWIEDYRSGFDFDYGIRQISNKVPNVFSNAKLEEIDNRLQIYTKKLLSGEYEGKGLYVYGGCGTGKTFAMWAIYKMVKLNDCDMRIISSIDLLNLLREDFNKEDKYGHDPRETNYNKIKNYDGILVIDDIGTEKYTDWAGEMFYSIINKRWEDEIPTFFTSNYSIKEISEKFGDRIASRIVGMCDIIKLEGKDKRLPEK